jgi:selenocysteine-specific elongation factor
VDGAPLTLGTAGHVDHGKTALVRALTGRETDRLPEERARGLTIEPGFAPLELPSGRTLSLVDVPGHERFVRHMVAGASGVDGWLLCVAADDGVMPQTREHMAVLRLLGATRGVVAITKSDLRDPGSAARAAAELAGPEAAVVLTSATTGRGIPELLAALDHLAAGLPRRTAPGRARLFVDRAFTAAGAGTVVTGTLWGAPIAREARVAVLPGGARGRVRGVQAHDRPIARAGGGRVALNLAGLGRDQVPRGSCVVAEGDGWTASDLLDVALEWLPEAGGELRTRRRLQAFLGTAETGATCVLLEGEALAPGARGYAQLRLDRPVPAERGDRLILRAAPGRTVGGATVVDPAPARHGRGSGAAARLRALERADPAELAALRLDEAGPAGLPPGTADAAALRAAGAVVLPGGWALAAARAAAAAEALVASATPNGATVAAALAASGLTGPVAEALVEALVAEGRLVRDGARLRPAGGPAPADAPAARAIAALLAESGRRGPSAAALADAGGLAPAEAERALGALRAAGRAVEAGGLWFDAAAAEAARAEAAAALAAGPMTIAALRDLWGVGRKHALALAAHLDRSGLTRREGDARVLRRGAAS